MENAFANYQLKQGKAPHKLADECQQLCDKLHIPFCTIIMRYLKIDDVLTHSLINYMAEKHINNVRYLTVAFNRQRKLRATN